MIEFPEVSQSGPGQTTRVELSAAAVVGVADPVIDLHPILCRLRGMSSDPTEIPSPSTEVDPPPVPNTVALIGVILIGVAAAMCTLMFALTNQLPDGMAEFTASGNNSPAHLRLLILGCSTAVLVVVALVLSVVGMLLPDRPRVLAIVGTVLSLLILLGVFGVLFVGVVMNPSLPVSTAAEKLPADPSVEDEN